MRHHVSKVLPYAPEQLFRLVGDVAKYPEFVPWITAMRTWNARTLSEGIEAVDAEAGVDFITIGQYLQPTRKHAAIDRFVHPDEFKALEEIARAKGFLMVSASPLTRSSHHAGEDFARLKAARLARHGV